VTFPADAASGSGSEAHALSASSKHPAAPVAAPRATAQSLPQKLPAARAPKSRTRFS
jgi:hypothetical protein